MHAVCGWVGNRQPVAAKLYLQITVDHFVQARQPDVHLVENPAPQPAEKHQITWP